MKSAKQNKYQTHNISDAPERLSDRPFYSLKLDEEQKEFVDAIYDSESLIVMCNSKAGTGKSTLAVGVGTILVQYGFYDGIVYITSATMEQRQGYLPGSQEDKSAPYMQPLIDALLTIGLVPSTVIKSDSNIDAMKNGTSFIEFTLDTYLRGVNFENKVVIIDEAQNFYGADLKKTLTRIHDSCKVIVIGHTEQCDLYKHKENSGFYQYLNAFSKMNDPRLRICKLTVNHRGWISSVCDNVNINM